MTTYCAPCLADLALVREAVTSVSGTAACVAHAVLLTHPGDTPQRRLARLTELRSMAEGKLATASAEDVPAIELLVQEYALAGAMDMTVPLKDLAGDRTPRPPKARRERDRGRGRDGRPDNRGERGERPGGERGPRPEAGTSDAPASSELSEAQRAGGRPESDNSAADAPAPAAPAPEAPAQAEAPAAPAPAPAGELSEAQRPETRSEPDNSKGQGSEAPAAPAPAAPAPSAPEAPAPAPAAPEAPAPAPAAPEAPVAE